MRFCAFLLLLLGVITASLYAAPADAQANAEANQAPARQSLSTDLGHRDDGAIGTGNSEAPMANKTSLPDRQARSAHHGFTFYDTEVRLLDDHDGDGFHSRFEVGFDADIDGGSAQVYARLYLTAPNGERIRYHTTDSFWLHGDSQFDRYWVTTELASGYPPGYYQLDLALYDVFDELVAVTDGSDSGALIDLPLEDAFEDNLVSTGLLVDSLTAVVEGDSDSDGYFHHLQLSFGARLLTPDPGIRRPVSLRVSLQPTAGGPWQTALETDAFSVYANSSHRHSIKLALGSSYPAGYYRIRLDFYDQQSDRLLLTIDDSHQALSALPMEDSSRDQRRSTAPVAYSEEHGGAPGGLLLMACLLALGWRHRARRG